MPKYRTWCSDQTHCTEQMSCDDVTTRKSTKWTFSPPLVNVGFSKTFFHFEQVQAQLFTMDSGYWGEPSSIMDFCEPNYAVSYYFAEFFNSMSSIPFCLQGLIGLVLTHKYATKEFRFKLCYFSLMLVGFGSFLFHASLLYKYQLLDELPMLLVAASGAYVTCTIHNAPGHTDWRLASALISSLLIEVILYVWFQVWSIFFIGYSFNVVVITYVMCKYYSNYVGPYLVIGLGLYYGAFMCWCIDMFFCDYVQNLQLHRFVCVDP